MPLFKKTPTFTPESKPEPTLEDKLELALANKSGAERLVHTGAYELERAADYLTEVRDEALDEIHRLSQLAGTADSNRGNANSLAASVLEQIAPVAPPA